MEYKPMEKKITDSTVRDLGLDPAWVRAAQAVHLESEEAIKAAHKIEDITERKAAIAAIHVEHRAKLAALKPASNGDHP